MNFTIFSLFTEFFPSMLSMSVVGRALKKSIWNLDLVNFRDFALDKRKSVDDYPFGGGKGMLLRADVIGNAIDKKFNDLSNVTFLYPSPRGVTLNQNIVRKLSTKKNIAIICGHYEGIDQRVIDYYKMEEISIGNYIISGGEIASLVIIDSIVRNLPNAIGTAESLKEESFGDNPVYRNLLEYNQYTRPRIWRTLEVPDVLISGNHKKIKEWKENQSKILTDKKKNLENLFDEK